jgi:Type I phosphodiesterase / nucleotide pyrophosphatase
MKSPALALGLGLALIGASTVWADDDNNNRIQHVLVISIDGMHSLDMALWVKTNPTSTLGKLAAQGMNYTNASTTKPSDSIPSTVGIYTGGSPAVGGMYYDDAYNRSWWAPTNLTCSGAPGTTIDLKQGINLALDGSTGVDPAKMPRHIVNGQCVPVMPHDMLRVNTVFEVVKSAHMRTAYSEKRPSYDFLNGPSGTGVDDLYTPEIACFPFTPPATCTNALLSIQNTKDFDELRVKSVLNEIDGKDHTGTKNAPVPALFGMNFQSVNAAKKDSLLPIVGGYADDYSTPNADLAGAIGYVDSAIGRMVAELAARGLTRTTAIIITAKHGETSLDPTKRFVESTSAIQKQLSLAGVPGVPAPPTAAPLIAKLTEKSSALIWLSDQSKTFTVTNVLTTAANEQTLNISQILVGDSLKLLFPDPLKDPATPDIVIVPNPGTTYEPAVQVLAEHGGFNENDVHVPLLVVGPSIAPGLVRAPVTTTQIAPTILTLLNLDPSKLQAVKVEGVTVLPGLPAKSGQDDGEGDQ